MERESLSLERQLVLMTAIEADDSQSGKIKEIVENKSLNWGEVIFQMMTHRTLPMFYYNLYHFDLLGLIDPEFKKVLEAHWNANGERNRYYLGALAEIMSEFKKINLVTAILKGNLLASVVYPHLEARAFNDLDMLMKLDDVNALTKVLEGLGYVQGEYDKKTGVITESSRKAKLMQQMNTHEIQEFLKASTNNFAKIVEIDVNHSILWRGNCPYKVDTKDLIQRAIPVEFHNIKGYMLDYVDNIIQLSCHLYKEATLIAYIDSIKDLKMYKFADLYMYIKKFNDKIDWNLLIERVKGYKLEKIVFYNFFYIEMMFGKIIPDFVKDSFKQDDLTFLDEYAIESQTPSVWKSDFFTRLFDINRVRSIDGHQYEKLNKFMGAKYGE